MAFVYGPDISIVSNPNSSILSYKSAPVLQISVYFQQNYACEIEYMNE